MFNALSTMWNPVGAPPGFRPNASGNTGLAVTVTNDANAYDLDTTTAASISAPASTGTGEHYYSFASQTVSSGANVNILCDLTATSLGLSAASCSIVYNLAGGTTWTLTNTITDPAGNGGTDSGLITVTIPLASLTGLNLSNLRVGVRTQKGTSLSSAATIYDIWVA